jgi:RecA-superfamily ATPases implicated in signal transduction
MGEDIVNQSFNAFKEGDPVDSGGFHVEKMNKCIDDAHQLPPLVPLYPDIVLEGDLCIIFGQSGIGKTIFAMQIARHIAENGKRLLYVDCEMTPRQLGNRYETANFPPTFLRAEMDREHPAEDVLKGIEEVAAANHVEVVFIDNITALGQSLDRSADAGTLMASLNTLKKRYNWTLVVLNHIPKMYSGNIPLSLSAMQGSAKINQLIDDAIGIAQSCIDSNLVYVKQCKWRNGELTMGADHVAVYERRKDEYGNLGFTLRGIATEQEHLSVESGNEREEMKARIRELSAKGMTQTAIAEQLGTSQSKVSRLLKE